MNLDKINRNFKYLAILNICTIIIPLITYPVMTERIGLERFGYIIYIQTIAAYFSVINSLGFNVSVTKLIAESETFENLKAIFWNVIYIKVAIWLILFIPYMIICNYFDLDRYISILLYFVILAEAIFPTWYYQGIQEMKAITVVNVIYRLVSLILILLIVDNVNGSLQYSIIVGVTPLILNLFNIFYLVYNKKISLERIDVSLCFYLVTNSLPIFWGSIVSVIKDRTNLILIGIFVGKSEVVVYDFIMKIISVLSIVFSNLTNAQFPEISKNKSPELFKKYFNIIILSSIFIYFSGVVVSYFFSDEIMMFALNSIEYSNVFPVLAVSLMALIPLRSISYQLGLGVLVSNGYDKDYSLNLMLSATVYLVFCFLLFVSNNLGLYTICLSLILTVALELLHRIWLCKTRGLINWVI